MERRRLLCINDQDLAVGLLSRQTSYQVNFSEDPDAQTDKESIEVALDQHAGQHIDITIGGLRHRLNWAKRDNQVFVQWGAQQLIVEDSTYAPAAGPGSAASGEVQAVTEGQLVALEVGVGDRVTKGQTLAVVEAMKMQHRHVADGDGVVKSVDATLNAQVSKGQLLVSLNLDSDDPSQTENAS